MNMYTRFRFDHALFFVLAEIWSMVFFLFILFDLRDMVIWEWCYLSKWVRQHKECSLCWFIFGLISCSLLISSLWLSLVPSLFGIAFVHSLWRVENGWTDKSSSLPMINSNAICYIWIFIFYVSDYVRLLAMKPMSVPTLWDILCAFMLSLYPPSEWGLFDAYVFWFGWTLRLKIASFREYCMLCTLLRLVFLPAFCIYYDYQYSLFCFSF